MNTLVLYGTQYGYTAECAAKLKAELSGDVTLVDVSAQGTPNLAAFDAVIVGGSIYMGRVQTKVSEFCAAHEGELLQKPLGLFLCCGLPQNLSESMANSFPEVLRKHAKTTGCFGGELRTSRMKPMHKLIAGMMQKAGGKSGIEPPKANPQAVIDFAAAMNA
ncbi:MAG TPA: flavodoxin domain-containing protein [Clostridia bacterium]|nr:flavodoxin domain-containing protein [Clostridia bacterium]